jgi:O-antigen/teichoic acid export membrane protein
MLVTLPIGFGLYSVGWGVVSLVAADGIAQSIAAVLLDAVRKHRCPWSVRLVPDPLSGFRKLIYFAMGSALGSIAWTIEAGADVFLLDWIPGGGGKEAVATYGMWWKFPQMAFTICSGLAASAFPSFSKLYAVNPADAAALLRRVAVPACGLFLLTTAGIGMWLTPFLHHWMGGRFDTENGPRLAVMIGLLVALRAYGNLLALFWLATGRSTLTTTLCWVQATVKVLLALWWIPIAGLHGLFAASCASVGIQILGVGFALYRTGLLSARDAMIALAGLAIVTVVSDAVAIRTTDFDRQQFLGGVALTLTTSGGVALGLRRRMRRVLTS